MITKQIPESKVKKKKKEKQFIGVKSKNFGEQVFSNFI